MIEQHIELLGKKAEDVITGFTGIITSINFDLYGCIQGWIDPPMDDKGELPTGKWFDVTRLILLDHKSVMDIPDFNAGYIAEGRKGGSDKSAPTSH